MWEEHLIRALNTRLKYLNVVKFLNLWLSPDRIQIYHSIQYLTLNPLLELSPAFAHHEILNFLKSPNRILNYGVYICVFLYFFDLLGLILFQLVKGVFVADLLFVHLLVSKVHLPGELFAGAVVSFVDATHCPRAVEAHVSQIVDVKVLSRNILVSFVFPFSQIKLPRIQQYHLKADHSLQVLLVGLQTKPQ